MTQRPQEPDVVAAPRRGAPAGVTRAAAASAIGGLLFGYDTGVISGALPFLKKTFGLSHAMEETVTAVLLFGAGVGAVLAGRTADAIGRKRATLVTAILALVGVVGSVAAPATWVLIVARAVLGLAVGYASVVIPLYIGEIAPPAVRGRLVSLNQLAITAGILLAGLVDYFLSSSGNWRLMISFAALPAVLLGVSALLIPESPHWLLRRGRDGEARRVLERLRGADDDVAAEIDDVRTTTRQQGGWRETLGPRVRPALIVGVTLAVIQQVTGINTVIYYAPTLLQEAGVGTHASILATVLVGAINVAMTIVALRLLDRVGRRPLLLAGTVGMVIGLFALGGLFLASGTKLHGLGVVLAMAALMFYVGSFAVGLGPAFWLLISEIYPLRVRGQAMGVATIFNWVANGVVALTYLSLLSSLGRGQTFLLYGAVTVASVLFMAWRVPETKGRPLSDIERDLTGDSYPAEPGPGARSAPAGAGSASSGPAQHDLSGRPRANG